MLTAALLGADPLELSGGRPAVSFEFFPPKTAEMEEKLWQTVTRLAPLGPRFVSVTYGAGGTTRERTHATVRRIRHETALEPAAHLTCIGASRGEIDDIARLYWESGVRHLVALRGDPPAGGACYCPHPDGYAYAADLVAGLMRVAPFEVSVAAYPETHPEAASPAADLDNLKRKIDAGAHRAITQLFFDAEPYLRLRDRARAAGIAVPIVPGILPVTNFAQVRKFAAACGASLPDWMPRLFAGLDDDPDTRRLVAASIAAEQCRRLQAEGVAEFHFYTLNRADLIVAICHMIGARAEQAHAAGDGRAHILEILAERVLLCDGAMGSEMQAQSLDIARDYLGQENFTDLLCETRPDLVRDIHLGHLRAGSDAIETNSFGASPITLGEAGMGDRAYALNRRAAEIAREAVEAVRSDGRPRFVLGAVGPGTRLPSLGHIEYAPLEDALAEQCRGLVAGGVDAFLIETCQDPLQIKAAVNGAKRARAAANGDQAIFVQVTVEQTGTLLVGADIAAAATVVRALDVPLIGINCATGPREMTEHVRWLAENWPGLLSVQPNAGLPELVHGHAHYPLTPAEMAEWQERFITEFGVNLIGGCCGSTSQHIAALDAMLRRIAPDGLRPRAKTRKSNWVPGLASLFSQVPLRQENAYLSIGERCNANGSKRFRQFQEQADWDGIVEMAREQGREGSHALDLCTAFVGRDEIGEMREAVKRLRGSITTPLVIDSTELPVLGAALEQYGGKPVINSVHFEDGEETAAQRLTLARRFGAAVIALTIDEQGMAKGAAHKLAIAQRLYDFACGTHGLPGCDLLIDPLTFTICTGNEDDRKLGIETLDGIEMIAKELPECQIILGLSNISFGLSPAARNVLNSVYLDHAMRRGLTGAILHVSKIVPLHQIPPNEVEIAEDLIFDRRRPGYDPLEAFIAIFENRKADKCAKKPRAEAVEERLKQRIVDGERPGLEDDLLLALEKHKPLDIINIFLLDGMKVVGELFGAGKMQLPFVLRSAEVMKAAASFLEPYMEKIDGPKRGLVVLATVKGDVHDIGKNLVDIILTNNGYEVVNLGIKQPLQNIIDAAQKHKADAIGMSGLLVKSATVMRENLAEMARQGITTPVLLGGAALTRRYVEEDCAEAYGAGAVAYARDAFDGLSLMDKVATGHFAEHAAAAREKNSARPKNRARKLGRACCPAAPRPVDAAELRLRRAELARDVPVPQPPFWGARVIDAVPVRALLPFLNERMLYQFHWGYRKDGRSLDQYKEWAKGELRPILDGLLDTVMAENILLPQAVYGYWRCAADGNDLVLYDEDGRRELARFALPRQDKEGGLSIADFVRDTSAGERDVIGLQVVTIGQRASDVARQWFAADRYRDYLYLHGLSVEMAEALAELTHARIRAELGFPDATPLTPDQLSGQHYRGSRYSFGYPACPNLADQRPLLKLLSADRIGLALSDEDQLEPEQSTSAIVLVHPQAKYFSV